MKISNFWLLAAVSLLLCSCSGSEIETGKGSIQLTLSNGAFFETPTKSVNESLYRSTDNYDVVITNANGKEVVNCKGSELGINLPKELEMGSYDIVASYGEEHDASRDNFYVEGSTSIVLKPKDVVPVSLVCTPTCGRISVVFTPDMGTYYKDYYMTFSGTEALGDKVITYAKGESEPWYVKLSDSKYGEEISYKLILTVKDEYQHRDADGTVRKNAEVTGKFILLRNKAQKLTVKPNYTPQTDGGMGLTITIDDSTVERPVDIEVPVSWI